MTDSYCGVLKNVSTRHTSIHRLVNKLYCTALHCTISSVQQKLNCPLVTNTFPPELWSWTVKDLWLMWVQIPKNQRETKYSQIHTHGTSEPCRLINQGLLSLLKDTEKQIKAFTNIPHTLCCVRNINLFTCSGWFTVEHYITSHESFSVFLSFYPWGGCCWQLCGYISWGGVSRADFFAAEMLLKKD